MAQAEFPSNSNNKKQPSESSEKAEDKIKPVVTSKVIVRKRPFGRRVADVLIGDETQSVGEYLIFGLLVPGVKNMFVEIVTQGVQKRVLGEVRPTRPGQVPGIYGGPFGNVAYHQRFVPQQQQAPAQENRPQRHRRGFNSPSDFILATAVEAQVTLDRMFERVETYGSITVADLKEFLNVTSEFTDNGWGWMDLTGSRVDRVPEGYLLVLPRPEPMV